MYLYEGFLFFCVVGVVIWLSEEWSVVFFEYVWDYDIVEFEVV